MRLIAIRRISPELLSRSSTLVFGIHTRFVQYFTKKLNCEVCRGGGGGSQLGTGLYCSRCTCLYFIEEEEDDDDDE